jgi:hypothetical protein
MWFVNKSMSIKPLTLTLVVAFLASFLTVYADQNLGPKMTSVELFSKYSDHLNESRKDSEVANLAAPSRLAFAVVERVFGKLLNPLASKVEAAKKMSDVVLTETGLDVWISDQAQALAKGQMFRACLMAVDADAINAKTNVALTRWANNGYSGERAIVMKDFKAKPISTAETNEMIQEIQSGTTEAVTSPESYSGSSTKVAQNDGNDLTIKKSRSARASNGQINQETSRNDLFIKESQEANAAIEELEKSVDNYRERGTDDLADDTSENNDEDPEPNIDELIDAIQNSEDNYLESETDDLTDDTPENNDKDSERNINDMLDSLVKSRERMEESLSILKGDY